MIEVVVFRLQTAIDELDTCPPEDCVERNVKVIRYVFQPLTQSSFETHCEKDPSKWQNKCDTRALSMFDTTENAREKFKWLEKTSRNLRKRLGTHLAQGNLSPQDGVVSTVNGEGHMSLFEYVDCDLVAKFEVLEKI